MSLLKSAFLFIVFLLFGFVMQQHVQGQCSAIINTFPYNENFESTDGNWTSSPSTEWKRGMPGQTKQLIHSAASGSNCWIVGGLEGSSYSSGNSSLVSPCFDFTTMINPEIKFNVFWECEKKFDGTTFQYSINGGSTWITLGSENSNANCTGTNWYNYTPVQYLGGQPGWSGNVQSGGGGGNNCVYGGGSNGWLTAKHNMSMLAGVSNVIFRFLFGAGTQCNDFDGFAVDDIHIGETPPPGIADFTYSCGDNGAVIFNNNSSACSIQWNFGDPGSGAGNASTAENPIHIFSDYGQAYMVTLTANFPTGPAFKNAVIYTIDADATYITANTCYGDSNIVLGLQNPVGEPTGIYNYSWNTNPVRNTPIIGPVPNQDFICTFSSPNACTRKINLSMIEPAQLKIEAIASPAKCGLNKGSINATVTGGRSPYAYSWSTIPVQITPAVNDLAPGNYSLIVSDFYGCTTSENIEVISGINPVHVSLGSNATLCSGQTLLLDPGKFASYKWQDGSTLPVYTVTKTGIYSVVVADTDGCTDSSSINVTVEKCKGIYFPAAFTPNGDALNSFFGPVGEVESLRNYSMTIYNRYAEVIFATNDPYKKWDGTYKGKALDTQAVVWTARYSLQGRLRFLEKERCLFFVEGFYF